METKNVIERANKAVTEAFNNGSEFERKRLIEKACKWIEDNIFDFPWYDSESEFTSKDIADTLRKYLEE